MGTPHRGSSKAALAEMVKDIAKVVLRQPNDNLIHDLQEDSAILEDCRAKYTTHCHKIPAECYYEEKPIALIGVVSTDIVHE